MIVFMFVEVQYSLGCMIWTVRQFSIILFCALFVLWRACGRACVGSWSLKSKTLNNKKSDSKSVIFRVYLSTLIGLLIKVH